MVWLPVLVAKLLYTYGSKTLTFIEICVLSWRRGPYLNSQSKVHTNQSEIRYLFKITKQTGIIVFKKGTTTTTATLIELPSSIKVYTVQKHTQNRPSTLRS